MVQSRLYRKRCFRLISLIVLAIFSLTLGLNPGISHAQSVGGGLFNLPEVGRTLSLTPAYHPVTVQGIVTHPDNGLLFDFVIHPGDDRLQGQALQEESQKLIKYFLAALTIPEDHLWVNLSPYEKNRITTDVLGHTEMGRDLLAQDYLLKQLAASLTDPGTALGQRYWQKMNQTHIQSQAALNRVWIVPEKAQVYEKENGAFIVDSHLKVLVEEDYKKEIAQRDGAENSFKELILPIVEKEVNEGKTFANLRQIYSAMILATWYKKRLKESLLGQLYVNKGLTAGVKLDDPTVKEQIFQQYLESFKRGVYNIIDEASDDSSGEMIPRKYFSGGFGFENLAQVYQATEVASSALMQKLADNFTVRWQGVELTTGLTLGPLNRSEFQLEGSLSFDFHEESLTTSSSLIDVWDFFTTTPSLYALAVASAGFGLHMYTQYSVYYLISRLGTSAHDRAFTRIVQIGESAVLPLLDELVELNGLPDVILSQEQSLRLRLIKKALIKIGRAAMQDLWRLYNRTTNTKTMQAIAEVFQGLNDPSLFIQVVKMIENESIEIQRIAAITLNQMDLRLINDNSIMLAFERILERIESRKITPELAKVFDRYATRSQQIRLRIKAFKAVGARPLGTLKSEEVERYLRDSHYSEAILAELKMDLREVNEDVRDQDGKPIILSDNEQKLQLYMSSIVMKLIETDGRAQLEYVLLNEAQTEYLRKWAFEMLKLQDRFPTLDISAVRTVLRYTFDKFDQALARVRLTELIQYHEDKSNSASAAVDVPVFKLISGQTADTMAFAKVIEKTRFLVKDRTIRLENNSQNASEMDLELRTENAEDQAQLSNMHRELGPHFGAYVNNSDALWFVRAKTMMILGTEKPVLWIMEIHASRVWWKMQEKFRKQYRTMRAELINHLSNQAKGMGYAAVIIPDEDSARPMAGTLVGKMSRDVIGIFYKQPKGFDRIMVEQEFNQRLPFELGHYIKWLTLEERESGPSSSSPLGGPADQVGGIDLNALHLDLQIKRDPQGVPLPVSQQPIGRMTIEGITPLIINIQPVHLPQILGQSS